MVNGFATFMKRFLSELENEDADLKSIGVRGIDRLRCQRKLIPLLFSSLLLKSLLNLLWKRGRYCRFEKERAYGLTCEYSAFQHPKQRMEPGFCNNSAKFI